MSENNIQASIDHIPNTPMGFVFFVAKQNALLGILAILCVTIAQLCGVSMPFVLKKIIDLSASGGNAEAVFVWLVTFPLLMLGMFGFYRLSGFIGMEWLTRTETESYRILFRYLVRHGHSYFSNRFAGSLAGKLTHVSEGTFRLMDSMLWTNLGSVISLIVTGIFITLTNAWVGLIYIALVSILIPVNYYIARYRRPYVVKFTSQKTILRGKSVDVITNIAATRQFSRHQSENDTISASAEKLRRADIVQWKLSEYGLLFNNIVIVSAVVGMLLVMYVSWVAGRVSSGDFVLVLTLITGLSGTLVFIGNTMNQFIRFYGEIEEGLEEILIPYEIADVHDAQKLAVTEGKIEWNNVSFKYESNTVFDGFNLTIRPGERIGLVGQSGAGKSTFVSLLLRQHELEHGVISIDGQNISHVTQDSLREHISVVPQEPMLFHRSIRENIMYGKFDATYEEIVAVAKKAQAHEFIETLGKGYDTLVGERGVKLSGGQKQRVAIARAMLKNAPILVLDEATSALDSESEVAIQKALHELMEGKTVIAIAHRLSTLREMDRIIVLENGKIIEDGTHTTLAKKRNGVYARLWKHQAGGFLVE